MTQIPTGGAGSKMRNRFCFSKEERERRKLDYAANMRLNEVIVHEEPPYFHDAPLPAIDQTRFAEQGMLYDEEDLNGFFGFVDGDFEQSEDDEQAAVAFWESLDVESSPAQVTVSPEHKAWRALKQFDLFQREDDEDGVWNALDDILELIEEGAIYNVDEVLQAISEVTTSLEAGTSENNDENGTSSVPHILVTPSSCVTNVSSSDVIVPANILMAPSACVINPITPGRSCVFDTVNPVRSGGSSSCVYDTVNPGRNSGSSADVILPDFVESQVEEIIPVGFDGLPGEDTISFLFDHISQRQVASRAQEQPAYKKLAALRERVLARLNRKNL